MEWKYVNDVLILLTRRQLPYEEWLLLSLLLLLLLLAYYYYYRHIGSWWLGCYILIDQKYPIFDFFSERELTLYAVFRPSVVCLSSVTFVHPTQAVVSFRNISTTFGTLAIRWHPQKILWRSS